MQVQVSGKQVDVGEALGSRISQELEDGVGKYFARGGEDAEVVVSKDGHGFKVDCWVRLASGQSLVTTGLGGDAHSAFSDSLDKLEKRVRRYKRRLKDHHKDRTEPVVFAAAPSYVLSADEDAWEDQAEDGLQPLIVAETELRVPTLSVGDAVMQMELAGAPMLVFRNEKHGGVNVVHRRDDGNVGWIDPRNLA